MKKNNSLKGSGAISCSESARRKKCLTQGQREANWMQALKRDIEWGCNYFWRQNPARQKIQERYLSMNRTFGNDFVFGKGRG